MARMKNKVALVVGGAKGIGFATAKRLAEEGATVVLTGRRADEVQAAAAKLGHQALGLTADAASQSDLLEVVRTVQAAHGRIDALVLNAGISEPAPIGTVTPDHFDRLFAVNVRGPVLASRRPCRPWAKAAPSY